MTDPADIVAFNDLIDWIKLHYGTVLLDALADPENRTKKGKLIYSKIARVTGIKEVRIRKLMAAWASRYES